jgi:O-antigen ligase
MSPEAPRHALSRFLCALGLGAWAVGAQSFEGVASAGLALTVFGAALALSSRELKGLAFDWWPVGLFVLWALLAPTVAGHPPSGSGLARTIDWLALPFAAVAWNQLRPANRQRIGRLAAVVLLISCALAGIQHFGVWPPHSAFTALKWTQLPFHRVYEQVPGTTDRFMGGGLPFHRLKFAHVTSLGVIAALVMGSRDTHSRKLWFSVAALAGLSVWLFPYARMAAVAMTLAVGFTLIRASSQPRRAARVAVGLAVAAIAIVLLTPAMRDRFASSFRADGNGERAELVETGIRAVEEHPLVGIGPGQFQPAKFAAATTPAVVTENPGKSHLQLLSIAAETGVPGAILFLLMLVWVARRGWSSPLAIGALAFFALLSLAHDPLFQAPFSMALVGLLGIAMPAPSPRSTSVENSAASSRSLH